MDLITIIIPILLVVLVISFMVKSLKFQERIAEAVEALARRSLSTPRDSEIEAHKQQKDPAVTRIPGIN